MVDLDQLWVASPDAVWCELSGEAVILDMASGKYFALDVIGGRIWNWLQTPCTTAALCDRLFAEYDVDEAVCRHDVGALVEQLKQHGLIQENAAGC